jgi:hypothetical protein
MHSLNFNLFLNIDIYNTRPAAFLATLDNSGAMPIIMMIVIVLYIAMYHDDCLGSVLLLPFGINEENSRQ